MLAVVLLLLLLLLVLVGRWGGAICTCRRPIKILKPRPPPPHAPRSITIRPSHPATRPLPELPPEFHPARSLLLPFILSYGTPPSSSTASPAALRSSALSPSGMHADPTTTTPPAAAAVIDAGLLAQHTPATAPTAVLPSALAAAAVPDAATSSSSGSSSSLVDPSMVRQLVRVCDMRLPHEWYPYAR